MTPLLSIITINYNNKAGLQKTFESVQNQTWQEFEYVVVDGGSSDGGKKLIEQNLRINRYVSEKDSGVYNAMNKGIVMAAGKYLLFMNSGDFFYDNTVLEKLSHFFQGVTGILYGDSVYFNNDGYHRIEQPPARMTFSFLYSGGINHQAAFIRRQLFFDHFFYNEKYKISSDWEFFIVLICLYNVSYQHVNEIICNYDYSGMSADPANLSIYFAEREETIQKYFAAFTSDLELSHEARAKRIQQVLHIKKFPVAWRIFKWFISLFLLFLPKFKLRKF